MKKSLKFSSLLLLGLAITACGGGGSGASSSVMPSSSVEPSSQTPSSSIAPTDINITDPASLNFAFNELYSADIVKDEANGFKDVNSLTKLKACVNGEYVTSFTDVTTRQDAKAELYTKTSMRFINVSAGYIFSLPFGEVEVNNEIGKYRSQFTFGDAILSVSSEYSNPYTAESNAWYTYCSEWIIPHISDQAYIQRNDLTRTIPMNYEFTPQHPYGDTEFKKGYDVYFFGIKINDENELIEKPYYSIAIVREIADVKNFTLFVMKSETDQNSLMEKIVTSYSKLKSKGIQRNYYYSEEAIDEPEWSIETRNYFHILQEEQYINWGAFSYSMPNGINELHAGNPTYDAFLSDAIDVQNKLEKAWDHKFEIYPTYCHIGNGNSLHYFPLDQANELAGGNGVNGKPVLQFTYQFTMDNNNVASHSNPAFDILRGKYDEHFRRLAQDMLEYGKPILFRLNNEMNTDWTSYSGIVSMLDPDIFVMTWRHLYDICIEEGCNNLIWIWNPFDKSAPYSSWGEDLCYFPGEEYVQLLGGTCYEFNNYSAKEAPDKINSFRKMYQTLYKKNSDAFSNKWKMILSEFACGSGGDASGELGRNAAVQAEWVAGMFYEINREDTPEYIKQMRGAIWFNANDYNSGNVIRNRLQLCQRPNVLTENYDDLIPTLNAFRDGFAAQDARK